MSSSNQCLHQETIFNFLNNHTHPNENAVCEKCNQKKECKVFCSTPKSRNLHKKCFSCIEIDRKEQEKLISEIDFSKIFDK